MPNLHVIYAILREWAVNRRIDTYGALSTAYEAMTGTWFNPHLAWGAPLGELNRRLHEQIGAPALSALVVRQDRHGRPGHDPGAGFWGCAPNVPPRPDDDDDRRNEWMRIVAAVHNYNWPGQLP
jgi:hypothetical protein